MNYNRNFHPTAAAAASTTTTTTVADASTKAIALKKIDAIEGQIDFLNKRLLSLKVKVANEDERKMKEGSKMNATTATTAMTATKATKATKATTQKSNMGNNNKSQKKKCCNKKAVISSDGTCDLSKCTLRYWFGKPKLATTTTRKKNKVQFRQFRVETKQTAKHRSSNAPPPMAPGLLKGIKNHKKPNPPNTATTAITTPPTFSKTIICRKSPHAKTAPELLDAINQQKKKLRSTPVVHK